MKVLLINGSPNEKGCTFTALSEVAETLNKNGVDTEIFWIGKKAVQGCIGCFKCSELGHCIFNDKVNELTARLDEFNGIIIGSPVYYAGPAGRLCAFLDRFFFSGDSSEICQQTRGLCSVVQEGRSVCSVRPSQQVFHDKEHAYSVVAVLESGSRVHA